MDYQQKEQYIWELEKKLAAKDKEIAEARRIVRSMNNQINEMGTEIVQQREEKRRLQDLYAMQTKADLVDIDDIRTLRLRIKDASETGEYLQGGLTVNAETLSSILGMAEATRYLMGRWKKVYAEDAAKDTRIAELETELAEGDSWMKRSIEFQENGGCPVCFAGDEAGHEDGCEWGKCEAERDKYRDALEKIANPKLYYDSLSVRMDIAKQAMEGGAE